MNGTGPSPEANALITLASKRIQLDEPRDIHDEYQDRDAAHSNESIIQPETNESVRYDRSQYRNRKEFLSSNVL